MKKLLNALGLTTILALGWGLWSSLPTVAQQVPKNYSLESGGNLAKITSALTTGTISGTFTATGSPASIVCIVGCGSAGASPSTVVVSAGNFTATGSPNSVIVINATPLGPTTSNSANPVTIATDQRFADPCLSQRKSNFALATNSTSTFLIQGQTGKNIYVCSIFLIGTAGVGVSLTEASSPNYASPLAVIGSTNASSGPAISANGGWTYGNGEGAVAATAVTSNSIYLITTSPTTVIGGNIGYIIQ